MREKLFKIKRKIITFFVSLFFLGTAITVSAKEADPEDEKIEVVEDLLRESAVKSHQEGKDIIWGFYSKNGNLQIFNADTITEDSVMEVLEKTDVDFVQLGQLVSNDELQAVKEAFEKDDLAAALFTIMPARPGKVDAEYEELKEKNPPVYWKITEFPNSDVFTLDVAIGRYVVRKGDNLYRIAKRYNTTVENLLANNSDIKDPRRIQIGQTIIIK